MTASMHDLRGAVRAASKRMLRHARSRVAGEDWGAELRRRLHVMLAASDVLVRAERARAAKQEGAGK